MTSPICSVWLDAYFPSPGRTLSPGEVLDVPPPPECRVLRLVPSPPRFRAETWQHRGHWSDSF